MDLATISASGQIIVPAAVCRALGVGPGDQLAFVTNEFDHIIVMKRLAAAMAEAKRSFVGAAGQAGLHAEVDVDRMIAEVRADRRGPHDDPPRGSEDRD